MNLIIIGKVAVNLDLMTDAEWSSDNLLIVRFAVSNNRMTSDQAEIWFEGEEARRMWNALRTIGKWLGD